MLSTVLRLLVFLFLFTSDLLAPYPHEAEPIGWDSMRYVLGRDAKYHGVMFEVAQELTFIKRAADYVRTVYEADGVEGVVRLTVFERNQNDYRLEEIYSGRLNLTTYQTTARGVTVAVEETGFGKKLTTLDDVPVSLTRTSSQGGLGLPLLQLERVRLHSQPLVQRTATEPTIFQPSATASVSADDQLQGYFYLGYGAYSPNELNLFTYATGFDTVSAEPAPLFTAAGNGPYEVRLTASARLTPRRFSGQGDFDVFNAWYYLRVSRPDGTFTLQTLAYDVNGTTLDVADLTATLPLRVGDKVFLFGRYAFDEVTRNAFGTFQFEISLQLLAGASLRVSAITRTPATEADGLLAYEALERTLGSITDTPRPLYSEYYGRTDTATAYAQDGPGSLRLLTDAWRMRNFPLEEKPFTLSFRQVYDALDAIDCLGMGLEVRDGRQLVRIEPRAYFYQAAGLPALQLGVLSELSKKLATERIYNTAQIGYQAWKSGAESSLAEVNGRRTYTLPITQAKGEYEALSEVSASGYLIEETRRDQYTLAPTREGAGDGTLFLVCLRRATGGIGFETERDEAFSLVEGIPAPAETYNLRLTPARMLRAHAAWLHNGLLRSGGRVLALAAIEGNAQVRTQLLSESAPVDEAADLPVDALPPALATAEVYTGTTTLRPAQLRQLRRRPYGLVSFLDERGTSLSGFVLSTDITPASRRCTLTLLRYS